MPISCQSIEDVVERQLCAGCGACAYLEPQRYRMGDAFEFGRRPFVRENPPDATGDALRVCPGVTLTHEPEIAQNDALSQTLLPGWGPVYGVWEGYAADSEIRFAGSSGGAATALALYCIESEGMGGVLHTAARPDVPFLNETVFSKSKADLLARTGSRYAPGSPAEGLELIERADAASVFIGKPCDVAGAQQARTLRPELNKKLGLTIAFFCAGVPSVKGNLELLAKVGVSDPTTLTELRYRGMGWPGAWTAKNVEDDGKEKTRHLTYAESWGFLQRYRQWRCYICPDHTGEFADVSVGDPWYRAVQPGEAGKSLLVARTKRGMEVIKKAESAGYLLLETHDLSLLPRSQPNLLIARGALWGRLQVLRLLGAAVPLYSGFPTFRFWWRSVSLLGKLQSLVGTAKRVFSKRLHTRVVVTEWKQRGHS